MKTLNLNFDEKTFKKLQNAKEAVKVLGLINTWEEYILKMCKIK